MYKFKYLKLCVLAGGLALATGSSASMFSFGESQPKVPEWYMSPPKNTETTLYGRAEGNTLKMATDAALAEIGASMGVTVHSETITDSSIRNERSSVSMDERIQTKAAAIEFSNFEVVQSDFNEKLHRYWVLVKVDKLAMAKELQFGIDRMSKEIDADFKQYSGRSSLGKVMESESLRQKLDQLKGYCTSKRQIDSSYNPEPLLADIRSKNDVLDRARSNLQVSVAHDPETKRLAEKMRDILASNKIKLVENKGHKGATTIVIRSDVKYSNVLKDYFAKMRVNVQAVDEFGKVLASSSFTESGASRVSQESALEQANMKLGKSLEAKGLMKSLGF